jgi:hypothetical protein
VHEAPDLEPAVTPAEPAPDPVPTHVAGAPSALRRSLGFLRKNAYLGLVAGGVLLVTEMVDFAPPPEVRIGRAGVAQLVGDAPPQEFSHQLANPQAVQVRATLRLYADHELEVSAPDPATDAQAKVLSQPVVTTILGMNAAMQQTVRLEGDDLEIDIALDATPRLGNRASKSEPHPIVLEHELVVKSRRKVWWRHSIVNRVHIDTRGFLQKVEDGGHRMVFAVDDHLFSVDLELRYADGLALPTEDETLAAGQ